MLSTGAGRVSTVAALLRQVWDRRRAGDPKLLRASGSTASPATTRPAPPESSPERGVGYRMAAPGDPVDAPSR